MKPFLSFLMILALSKVSFFGRAQVTKLSNNTDLEDIIPLGNIALLVSKSDSLWRTDGSAAGTFKYANNVAVSPSHESAIFNNKLYFSGVDANGEELWVTDGTAAGTKMIANIKSGVANSSPSHYMVFNNVLYFFADDGINGIELWKSDGTTGGTSLFKDINPGAGSSVTSTSVVYYFVLNNLLYFTASNGQDGTELWRTDGTANGTFMVKDINPGPASSDPHWFHQHGSIYLFAATHASYGEELWKTDGTEGGTELVKDIQGGSFGSSPGGFVTFNNKVYFNALNFDIGFEGWVTDGTRNNTTLLKDIDPGPDSGFPVFLNALFINNKMIFPATTTNEGGELWWSDGTKDNTTLFKDINNGVAGSEPFLFLNFLNANGQIASQKTLSNGVILIQAKTPDAGTELWKTDGTPGNTIRVKDINPGVRSSMGDGESFSYFYTPDHLYFSATNGVNGYELWKSDGTEGNTNEVIDIYPGTNGSNPRFIGAHNGVIYFTAHDGDNTSGKRDLFRIDGTFSTLPLNLLQFTGTVSGRDVRLSWTTTAERNTSYFAVERSYNGSQFETAGNVAAQKNSTEKKEYSFNDADALNGTGTRVYYRLKMWDNDGKFTYSKVITFNSVKEKTLLTYPNPATSEVKVTFNSGIRKQHVLKIFDESGRQVYRQQLSGVQGNNSYLINVASFAKGSYYIHIETEGGVETTKFIKQ